jgi:hypothetical protein
MRTPASLAAAALLAAACSSPPSEPLRDGREMPAARQQPSYIAYPGAAVEVDAPSTVRAGEPLTVRVATFGDGCSAAGGDDVVVQGLEADVLPWELDHSGEKIDCPDLLRTFHHSATVRFQHPGMATVRINGRRLPGDEPVVVMRSVTVTAN